MAARISVFREGLSNRNIALAQDGSIVISSQTRLPNLGTRVVLDKHKKRVLEYFVTDDFVTSRDQENLQMADE